MKFDDSENRTFLHNFTEMRSTRKVKPHCSESKNNKTIRKNIAHHGFGEMSLALGENQKSNKKIKEFDSRLGKSGGHSEEVGVQQYV